MPTGYTHAVQTGKVTEFPEFAMECARAFGALVMLRDDSGADIPEVFEPSSYHADAVITATERITELRSMTMEDIQSMWQDERDKAIQHRREYAENKAAEKDRYEAMLEKVDAWTPPTEEHVGLHNFMVKQLTESIDFDCGGDYLPALLPGRDEWWEGQIKKAEKDIDYHEREYEKEVERTDGRNNWLRDLRESLADA